MPKSIKKSSEDIRCPDCEKLLATPQGIKCPRCKRVHTFEECFEHSLCVDQYHVAFLWASDGSCASSIVIKKEIWNNWSDDENLPPRYPVFFLYNYVDPSKAFAEGVGCRVNKDPFYDFIEILKLATLHESEARASGKWVDVTQVKERGPERDSNGLYDFRSLSIMARDGITIEFSDLQATLTSYTLGAAIHPQTVIDIIEKMELMKDPTLLALAITGMENARHNKTKEEWQVLVSFLKRF